MLFKKTNLCGLCFNNITSCNVLFSSIFFSPHFSSHQSDEPPLSHENSDQAAQTLLQASSEPTLFFFSKLLHRQQQGWHKTLEWTALFAPFCLHELTDGQRLANVTVTDIEKSVCHRHRAVLLTGASSHHQDPNSRSLDDVVNAFSLVPHLADYSHT